jgi:16S rRNA (cytosine967-C5)-methyltransferase
VPVFKARHFNFLFMKFDNQLRYAVNIINAFKGEMPLHNWLKNFFRENKQMGSKDRKQVSELVYCYYRLGKNLSEINIEEKILTGLFLCNNSNNELLNYFKPDWNNNINNSLEKKLSIINYPLLIQNIFPWKEQLSEEINHQKFSESFLIQPDLFIRIRPGYEKAVKQKLDNAEIKFKQINNSCIALNNATKIDEVININKEVVVQDYSSQQIEKFLPTANRQLLTVWDCCAASGGKSLMLYDINPNIDLTVTDIRESILINLKKRFSEAGIKNYKSYTEDLSSAIHHPPTKKYDLIIADVPCSGSGTWSRTPEALCFFEEKEIEHYTQLQKKIISNIIPQLKKGGNLVYITCSVFKKENEEMVDFISQNFHLQLEKMELIKGYETKADAMFAARFIY